MQTIKAIITDDEPELRRYLRSALRNAWPELDVCAEADNGHRALALIEQLQPQIAFLDIRMPGLSGMEVAAKINAGCRDLFFSVQRQIHRRDHPGRRIFVFIVNNIDRYVKKPASTLRFIPHFLITCLAHASEKNCPITHPAVRRHPPGKRRSIPAYRFHRSRRYCKVSAALIFPRHLLFRNRWGH